MGNIREIMVDDFTRLFNQTELTLKYLKALPTHLDDLKARGLTGDQRATLIEMVEGRRKELLSDALELGPRQKGREI